MDPRRGRDSGMASVMEAGVWEAVGNSMITGASRLVVEVSDTPATASSWRMSGVGIISHSLRLLEDVDIPVEVRVCVGLEPVVDSGGCGSIFKKWLLTKLIPYSLYWKQLIDNNNIIEVGENKYTSGNEE